MTGIHDDEKRIDELRSRLYDRGQSFDIGHPKATLTDTPVEVSSSWVEPPHPKVAEVLSEEAELRPLPMVTSRRKKYRWMVIKYGALAFVVAIALSSLALIFGNNSISGENISISLNGPFTIGGGETLNLQVGVTNENAVSIQSATLIIEYPNGSRSVGENPRDVFIERIPLQSVSSGQTVNTPLEVSVFGEENDEKVIKASIEYRVAGSNATFFKEAEPLRFKISSSPVVLRIESNKKASSGQEATIKVIVASNSKTPLKDILVEAEYPNGFDFLKAEPSPFTGKNKWKISNLEPGASETIEVKGIVGGQTDEKKVVHFKVGVPQEKDATTLATIFNIASTEFLIENPFLGLQLTLSDDTDGVIVSSQGQVINGEIAVKNTLSDTIYDTVVTLKFSGTAVSDPAVSQTDGYYKSSTDTITWDSGTNEHMQELLPGDTILLSFSFKPDEGVTRTPNITLDVNAESRRVSESRVPEKLLGSVAGEVKVASSPVLSGIAEYVSGEQPPKAEQETVYTITLVAENGSNELNDAEVTFTLPPYVAWNDATNGPGTFTFVKNTRLVTWKPGDIKANGRAVAIMGVTLEPSIAQIGSTPTLINAQTLKGSDAYTSTSVRTVNSAITAEIKTDDITKSGNGRVSG